MQNNLLITMSGGTTCVINATLAGIIEAAQKSGKINKIFGGHNGLSGVLNNDLIDLTELDAKRLQQVYYTPASGLIGTSRIRPIDQNEITVLSEIFDKKDIKYFFNIGGNGTIKQSMAISSDENINVVSIAKTVDNDLGDEEFKRVYYTPGYPSCANYWAHKIHIFNQENLGAYSHDQVLIAQTFGRETGHLAACARLADSERKLPLLILLPEDQQTPEELIYSIKHTIRIHGRAMVVMSEGYYVADIGVRRDPSGQVMYGTSQTTQAQNLVNLLFECGIQARTFIPGFDQRSDILFATKQDLAYAYGLGDYAIQKVLEGDSRFLASISFIDDSPQYSKIPFSEIGDFTRTLPDRWLKRGEYDVSDEFIQYAMPFIDYELVKTRFYLK